MTTNPYPQTLQDAILYFADKDRALEYVAAKRWPNGTTCPHCGSKDAYFLRTRRIWKCKDCRKQFSIKTGTIFEDSPIGLDKWLCAAWMIANDKNGISSYEIHRGIGVTQKTAWFMLHRIRLAMQIGSFDAKLSGEVEVDETYIGGKARNMHKHKREKLQGRGGVGKTIVAGLLERKGKVRTRVVDNAKGETLRPLVGGNVEVGASVYSDELPSYDGLEEFYTHQVIKHSEKYVEGRVHINGIENYWSLLKRTLKGTYVSVEQFHLFRYLDEQSFRFNNRAENDYERFETVIKSIAGKRLGYKTLTGKFVYYQLELL